MKVTILDHTTACITPPLPPGVSAFLSYKEKGYNPNTGKWKQSTKSLCNAYGQFLAGLVPSLCARFAATEVEDLRQFPSVAPEVPVFRPEFSLREYQIDYLTECLTHERALIKGPTGSGKTALIAAVIAAYRLPTLLLVPNNTVRSQLLAELPKILPIDGQDDTAIGPHGGCPKIMVTRAGNIHDAPDELLRSYPLLIADEAHTCAAQQAMDVIRRSQAPFRFGFTATPEGRSDGRDLIVEGLFGPIIECTNHEELVEQGFHPEVEVMLYYAGWEGDFAYMEDLLFIANTRRNEEIAQLARQESQHGAVLILVRRLEHGKLLRELLERNPPPGKRVYYIDGKSSDAEREAVRAEAAAGMVGVIISTNVFAVGLDIPSLRVGINAAGGRGAVGEEGQLGLLVQQKMGRLLRPYGGEIKRWIDFFDDYATTVRRHSQERAVLYGAKADRVKLMNFPAQQHETVTRMITDGRDAS